MPAFRSGQAVDGSTRLGHQRPGGSLEDRVDDPTLTDHGTRTLDIDARWCRGNLIPLAEGGFVAVDSDERRVVELDADGAFVRQLLPRPESTR